MPYLGIFGLEFSKPIVIFEIGTLKFVYLQNFAKKQKCQNLRTKMLDFRIFEQEFQKVFVIFEMSTLKYFKNVSSTRAVNSGTGSSFLKLRGPLLLKVRVRVRVRFIKYAHR